MNGLLKDKKAVSRSVPRRRRPARSRLVPRGRARSSRRRTDLGAPGDRRLQNELAQRQSELARPSAKITVKAGDTYGWRRRFPTREHGGHDSRPQPPGRAAQARVHVDHSQRTAARHRLTSHSPSLWRCRAGSGRLRFLGEIRRLVRVHKGQARCARPHLLGDERQPHRSRDQVPERQGDRDDRVVHVLRRRRRRHAGDTPHVKHTVLERDGRSRSDPLMAKKTDIAAAKARKQKIILAVGGVALGRAGRDPGAEADEGDSSARRRCARQPRRRRHDTGHGPGTTTVGRPRPSAVSKPGRLRGRRGAAGRRSRRRRRVKLASFTLFEAEGSFVQQVGDETGLPASRMPPPHDGADTAPGVGGAAGSTDAGRPRRGAGRLRDDHLDGKPQQLQVKQEFPKAEPMFVLVSLRRSRRRSASPAARSTTGRPSRSARARS